MPEILQLRDALLLLSEGKLIPFGEKLRCPVEEAVKIALDVLIVEPETLYEVGSTIALQAIRNPHENDSNADWAMEMLGKSRDQRAINILVKFFDYDISGTDHITCCREPTAKKAAKVLTGLIGDDSKLKYHVAIAAEKSINFYVLKEWVITMLRSIKEEETYYKPAQEMLKKY